MLATKMSTVARTAARHARPACGACARPARVLQVRAFQEGAEAGKNKEEPNKEQQPESYLERRQQAGSPAPGGLTRPGAMRLPSLFREMEREMDALTRSFFGGDMMMPRSSFDVLSSLRDLTPAMPDLPLMSLATDITESDEAYTLKADVPGMSKGDVSIRITPDHVLQVSGERKEESTTEGEGGVRRVERSFGKFSRSFVLPKNVNDDGVAAEVREGVLTITLPKREEEAPQHKEVPIA